MKAIHELEVLIRKAGFGNGKEAAALKAELEQVKIKLQLIEDKIEGNLGGKKKKEMDDFSTRLKEKLAGMKKKMEKRKPGLAEHWGHFTKEMDEAFGHVKKAFGQ